MAGETVLIALGGNAIKKASQEGTTEEQFANIDETAQQICKIAMAGYRVVLTHGNGPQAGSLLIQQDAAADQVPAQTLAVCGAMTQGQVGWMLQNRLKFHLERNGINSAVCSVVTQIEVDADDTDFDDPSKPVGPFYTKEDAERLQTERGYLMREVKPGEQKGWRRVVPSPEPRAILESEIVRMLASSNAIVIASGGGGVPVVKQGDGSYNGVDAVIDKDKAGFILARSVNADFFLIMTDVEQVYLNYNKPNQESLSEISAEEIEAHYLNNEFGRGSMGPKVLAGIRFIRWGGKRSIITSLDKGYDALLGKAGTHIIP
jgi:carbamate kinase